MQTSWYEWSRPHPKEASVHYRSCATWRATSRTAACEAALVIDRDTASRLGITPQMIDDTLYDAFGQRQVSTIFTQLNQYHVVLEVKPSYQKAQPGGKLKDIYVRVGTNGSAGAI